jgi:hypothetical protein
VESRNQKILSVINLSDTKNTGKKDLWNSNGKGFILLGYDAASLRNPFPRFCRNSVISQTHGVLKEHGVFGTLGTDQPMALCHTQMNSLEGTWCVWNFGN